MSADCDTYVVIPAYNPDEVLVSLIDEIKLKTDFKIVIVDDGSSQDCESVFKYAGDNAVLLRHAENMGKGQALKTAFSYLVGLALYDNTTVLLMDADGQHKVDDAIALSQFCNSNPDSLCIGSRAFEGKIPLRSSFGNRVTKFVFKAVTGVKLTDTQSGLRAFKTSLLEKMLEVGGSRYEYEMNMLLSAARFKIPMREMPIKTIYVDGNSGSYFNPIKDSAKIYFEIIKFCSVSLISFVIDFAAYALFTALLFSLPQGKSVGAANVAARILSASVNFMLNRKFVFDHKSSAAVSALKYAVTACIVLAANTFLLRVAVCRIGINKYAAKLIVEPIMFLFSWSAQHFFVFAKKRDV